MHLDAIYVVELLMQSHSSVHAFVARIFKLIIFCDV
jgi:hypothetical protein